MSSRWIRRDEWGVDAWPRETITLVAWMDKEGKGEHMIIQIFSLEINRTPILIKKVCMHKGGT